MINTLINLFKLIFDTFNDVETKLLGLYLLCLLELDFDKASIKFMQILCAMNNGYEDKRSDQELIEYINNYLINDSSPTLDSIFILSSILKVNILGYDLDNSKEVICNQAKLIHDKFQIKFLSINSTIYLMFSNNHYDIIYTRNEVWEKQIFLESSMKLMDLIGEGSLNYSESSELEKAENEKEEFKSSQNVINIDSEGSNSKSVKTYHRKLKKGLEEANINPNEIVKLTNEDAEQKNENASNVIQNSEPANIETSKPLVTEMALKSKINYIEENQNDFSKPLTKKEGIIKSKLDTDTNNYIYDSSPIVKLDEPSKNNIFENLDDPEMDQSHIKSNIKEEKNIVKHLNYSKEIIVLSWDSRKREIKKEYYLNQLIEKNIESPTYFIREKGNKFICPLTNKIISIKQLLKIITSEEKEKITNEIKKSISCSCCFQ